MITALEIPVMGRLFKYQLQDSIRSKWILIYAVFFFFLTDLLFRFAGQDVRVFASLMNVVLLIVPLVSIMLGAMHFYNSREYIELMLAQPVRRSDLYFALYGGLAIPLSMSFLLGAGIPFFYAGTGEGNIAFLWLLFMGVMLTLSFVGIGFWISQIFEDRLKGIAFSLGLWLFFTVIYDGLILLFILSMSQYPIEKPIMVLSLLNPVDLGRILLLLQLDIAALMGYTGALFEKFFGSAAGTFISMISLLLWTFLPLYPGFLAFRKRNF